MQAIEKQLQMQMQAIEEQIIADEFDTVYLPSKQMLPKQLSAFIQKEQKHNPYFKLLCDGKPLKGVYYCQNEKCGKELFYSDGEEGKSCPRCNAEIGKVMYQEMQIKMRQYEADIKRGNTAMNNAVHAALQKIMSSEIIRVIQEYSQSAQVNYVIMNFDRAEYSVTREGLYMNIARYVGDKTVVECELNKRKYELQLGDVITVDDYGSHFVGFDENCRPKLIVNPCYFGNDNSSFSNSYFLCVPLEITERINDFMNFYQLMFINVFDSIGREKIRHFPVSFAAVSFEKLKTLKELLSLSDDIFLLPNDAQFFLQSRNFSYIDTLHCTFDDELLTICIDQTRPHHYKMGEKMLSLILKNIKLVKGMKAKQNH